MFFCSIRCSTGPIVFFQRYILPSPSPCVRHPPGKRINPGFISASSWARSARSPFGLFLKVAAGNKETTSSASLPGVVPNITSDALSQSSAEVREAVYCCQSFDAAVSLCPLRLEVVIGAGKPVRGVRMAGYSIVAVQLQNVNVGALDSHPVTC